VSDYHNEIDPFAAQWTRNLIANRLIAPGEVDERSIRDVQPSDLKGFTRCHFFSGIGGWAFALRLAGWPDDRPVWTGSCPCQPFSNAGRKAGFDDDRHLWPEQHRLIAECRPSIWLGEQVAGAADWLRLVRSDLEAMDYAVGAIPMEAACCDADHFRNRYWIVANAASERGDRCGDTAGTTRRNGAQDHGDLALANDNAAWELQSEGRITEQRGWDRNGSEAGSDCTLANSDILGPQEPLGIASDAGTQRPPTAGDRLRDVVNDPSFGWGEGWTESEFRSRGFTAAVANIESCQYLECPDGKWRRLPPPGVRWLGTRIPARISKLRALGNGIDARAARTFIEAVMECVP
jgi:DNA (cytosine-5)-methyltransferase 1